MLIYHLGMNNRPQFGDVVSPLQHDDHDDSQKLVSSWRIREYYKTDKALLNKLRKQARGTIRRSLKGVFSEN
jgi:hypothetical protein